jgi:hypothetical protein
MRGVHADHFIQVLPLLRRTFSEFPAPERRLIGERLKRGGSDASAAPGPTPDFDVEAARRVLPLLRTIWSREPVQ